MTDPTVPADCCQRCGASFAAMVTRQGTSHDREPDEGDIVICPACGLIEIATGVGYEARLPTAVERAEIKADPEVVERISMIALGKAGALAEGRRQRFLAQRKRAAAKWN